MKKLILYILTIFVTEAQAQVVESWIENKNNFLDSSSLVYEHGRIFLCIKISEDTTLYRFLLDSGAPTCIDKRIKQKFGLASIKKIATGSSIENQKDSTELVVVPKIHLSNIIFINTLASAVDLTYLNAQGLNISGIIGANVLQLCIWQFDLNNRKLFITDKISRLANHTKNQFLSFRRYGLQGSPLIKVTHNDRIDEEAIFDTGSDLLFTLSTGIYKLGCERSVFSDERSEHISGQRGTIFGQAKLNDITFINIDNLRIGSKLVFDNVRAEVLSDVSLIGTQFLEKYITTLDFKKNRLYYY